MIEILIVLCIIFFYYVTIYYLYYDSVRIQRVFWGFHTHPAESIFRLPAGSYIYQIWFQVDVLRKCMQFHIFMFIFSITSSAVCNKCLIHKSIVTFSDLNDYFQNLIGNFFGWWRHFRFLRNWHLKEFKALVCPRVFLCTNNNIDFKIHRDNKQKIVNLYKCIHICQLKNRRIYIYIYKHKRFYSFL